MLLPRLSKSLVVLFLRHGVVPCCLATADCQMDESAAFVSAVPVNSAGWAPNNISDGQSLGHAAHVADPARAGLDFKHLTILVVVPVGSGAWGEGGSHHGCALFLLVEDAVLPNFAGECWTLLHGLAIFGPGGMNS